ncbi:MAG: hypothetical protein MZV64_31795 [Ignavibacteriales bacterium]|nr:hypothetical protein [Ignavibacteriales bacterium]
MAALAERKARLEGERVLRRDTDGQDDHVGLEGVLPGGRYEQPVRLRGDGPHPFPQRQRDALCFQVRVDQGGHLVIQRGHDLVLHLEDGGGNPPVDEVFRHLDADEPAADDHRPFRGSGIHEGPDPVRVGDGAQAEHLLAPDAVEVRVNRLRTRREDDLVVAHRVGLAGGVLPDVNNLVLPVDGGHLAHHPHVDAVAFLEHLGSGQEQVVPVLDHMTDVVGKPAVGKRDVRSPLEERDLRAFVHPPGPGRCCRTPCHAAHDHQPGSHGRSSFPDS